MVSGNRGNHILELKKTPFSNREGRFFFSKRAFLHTKETPPLFVNNSIHSPLHSERGWGRGSSLFANNGFHSPLHLERGWGRGSSLSANNGFHSPLHSERGWGRGCRGMGERLRLSLKQQISGVNMIDF